MDIVKVMLIVYLLLVQLKLQGLIVGYIQNIVF